MSRNPRQRSEHSHLLCDVSAVVPHPQNRHRSRLDAIVVPSGRSAQALTPVIRLSAAAGTRLVVFCSRSSRAAEVADLVAKIPGARALLVDVPADYKHEWLDFSTSDERFWLASARRVSDLSLKRNLGLLLARLQHWSKIAFIDDDISEVTTADLAKLAIQLDRQPVAGMRCRKFPDNSVVFHANRLSGEFQDVFVTGAVLGVNTTVPGLPFFPEVYNEDWLFFHEQAAARTLPLVGEARQRPYSPFDDPGRAQREEFGDVLAEGLFALFDESRPISAATSAHWDRYIVERQELIQRVRRDLVPLDREDTNRAVISLDAALRQHGSFSRNLCLDFLDAWSADRSGWQLRLTHRDLRPDGSATPLARALDLLQLDSWRYAEFANSNVNPRVSEAAPEGLSRKAQRAAAASALHTARLRPGSAAVHP